MYFIRLYFKGVVAFSSQGDRIALTQIEQMIDGKYVILGYYNKEADNLSWTGQEKWHDNKVGDQEMITSTCDIEYRFMSTIYYCRRNTMCRSVSFSINISLICPQ